MNNSAIINIDTDFTVAVMTCLGYYGNGIERVEALELLGFDSEKIQNMVNDIFPIMKKYGVV